MVHSSFLPREIQAPRTMRDALELFVTITTACAVVFLLGVCVYRAIDALWYAPINVDAGAYLYAAERMKEGWVPERDFTLGYAPLGVFLLSIASKIVPSTVSSYQGYLTLLFVLQWGCAIIIYFIGERVTPSKTIRLLTALSALLIFQIYEGAFICLEVFVTFFTLLALLMITRPSHSIANWVIAGLFVGFAFLSKQYGAAALPALGAAALCNRSSWRQKFANIIALGIGFSAVVIAYFALLWLLGLTPTQTARALFNWMPSYYPGIFSNFSNLKRFTQNTFPFLALTPFLYVFTPIRNSPIYRAAFFMLICLGVSLLVRPFLHYFQLVIPFVAILALVILEQSRRFGSLFLFIVATAYIYPVINEHLKTPYFNEHKDKRPEQFLLAREINAILPPHSNKVLVFADFEIMYTANFLPGPKFGPGYLFQFSGEQLCSEIESAHFLVIDRTNKNYFLSEKKRIENTVGDFFSYIKSQGFTLRKEIRGHIQIWAR